MACEIEEFGVVVRFGKAAKGCTGRADLIVVVQRRGEQSRLMCADDQRPVAPEENGSAKATVDVR